MLIKLNQTDGTLPFISELPDFAIGQLEGYNGVGKSLTISALELCAGKRPLMEPSAWDGFCTGLGSLDVIVTELTGAESIRWSLNGAHLLEASRAVDPAQPPTRAWFTDVRINDVEVASIEEVRALFTVERINGDAGLIEELAGLVDEAVRDLDAFRVTLLESPKLSAVENNLSSLERIVSEISVGRVVERAEAASAENAALAAAEERMSTAASRRDALDEAVRFQSRLEEIAIRGGALDEAIVALDDQIGPLRKQREDVGAQLEAAEAASAQSEDVRRDLEAATKTYKSASTRLRTITQKIATARQVADLSSDDDDPAERLGQLRREVEKVRAVRVGLDAGPVVLGLIESIRPPVAEAADSGAGDQVLLADDVAGENALTVSQVSTALNRRRLDLLNTPVPYEAEKLDREADGLFKAIEALESLSGLERDLKRARERQDAAEARGKALSEQLDQSTTEHLDELRARRRSFDDTLSELGGQRAVLAYRRDALGAPGEDEAIGRALDVKLRDAGIAKRDLNTAFSTAVAAYDAARGDLEQARAAFARASSAHERDLNDIRTVCDDLSQTSAVAWMASGNIGIPTSDQELEAQLAAIERLQLAAEGADRRLTGFRQLFLGMRASMEAVAASLRGRTAKAEVRVPQVFQWLEGGAAEWFRDENFRTALLGESATDVSVDLRTRQVAWRSGSDHHTKPIEALSSGERAFAFTQARLARLRTSQGASLNRVIALDEFGAFVSSNRVKQLADYLGGWRETHPNDQILVILPANQDYATLARATRGPESTRFARMAERLATQAWFVEEFAIR